MDAMADLDVSVGDSISDRLCERTARSVNATRYIVYRLRKTRLLCGGDQPISQVFHISEVARPISARADTYRNAFNRGLNEVFASAVSGAIHESCSYTDDVHVEVRPIRPAEHLRSVFGSIVMTDR